jgi:hypothetical protein
MRGRNLVLAIIVVAVIGVGLWGLAYRSNTETPSSLPGSISRHGVAALPPQGIEGNATINYWAIICPSTVGDIGMNLNVTSTDGSILEFPLSWSFIPGCEHAASFHVQLPPGKYSVTLSTQLGCYKPELGRMGGFTCDLPYEVEVEPGRYSMVNLYVYGGL